MKRLPVVCLFPREQSVLLTHCVGVSWKLPDPIEEHVWDCNDMIQLSNIQLNFLIGMNEFLI